VAVEVQDVEGEVGERCRHTAYIFLTFFSSAAYFFRAGAPSGDLRPTPRNGRVRYFFADYTLDTDRRELRHGADVVPTTPQVFDLLDYLIRNREHVVSKDDLVSAIWKGRIVSDAALTTRLNAARSVIGDCGAEQRLIKTLRRKGCRFVGAVQETNRPSGAATVSDSGADSSQPLLALPDKPSIAVLSRRKTTRAAGLFGGFGTLTGAFAAYSAAWSPAFRGRLIRGALRLASGRSDALVALYCESLFGREVFAAGETWIGGRTMYVVLREPAGELPLFLSLHIPGPPIDVICGVMSGFAFVSHEALPSACRIVFIRAPDTPRLNATNRYFDPVPGAVAADLADLGVDVPAAAEFDSFTREFLGAVPLQATALDQAMFASRLDRQRLGG
jgi:DNA-binding winged helix-turn-helix (wHTH) protein